MEFTGAKRGDMVLFPIQIVAGPSANNLYDVWFWDEWMRKNIRCTVLLPPDTKIIGYEAINDDISDEVTGAGMTMPENNTYGDIDYNDPSTFTVKHLPDPTAWNGPDWLTDGSTPEEIKAMQQMAIDDAHQLEMGVEPMSRFPPLKRPGE
jgi:hypothetical protein